MERKFIRRQELKEFKRQKILTAAKTCFATAGLDGTTMRAIAAASGYSVGAAYAYFPGRNSIIAALLASSLTELYRFIQSELKHVNAGEQSVRQAFSGFATYFLSSKEDHQLLISFYASRNANSHDLAKNDFKQLNDKFLSVLGLLAITLHENSNVDAKSAQTETAQAVTFIIGVLSMNSSGHLSLMGQSPQEMVDQCIDRMLLRCN
jgi:AcrR family transcriptional regulator